MNFRVLTLVMALLATTGNTYAQCGSATNLTHTFSNAINTFSWNAVPNAVNYQLQIVESGAYDAPELLTTTTSTSFTTPGGLLSASYDWRIITTCQNGDTDTSGFATFTLPCPEPTALSTTNISQTGATLNWVNPYNVDQGVIVAYRPLGGSWINLTTFSQGSSWVLNNLSPNTTYEWCANLNCSYFDSAPVIVQFTTLPLTCPVPTAANVTNITNTSARLNWTGILGGNTTGYTVQYKELNATTWNTATTTNNYLLLTGLTLNTAYQYKIASICGSTESIFTPVYSFYTNCVSLNNSAEHISFFWLSSIQRTSGAEPNGYTFQNTINTNLVAGASYQLRVRAGFSGPSYAQNFAAYLDVNGNGIYENTERVVGVGMISNSNIRTYNFTVPATTVPGPNKLRVILLRQNQGFSMTPCMPVGVLGEVEDYALNILPAAQSISEAPHQDQGQSPVTYDIETAPAAPQLMLTPNPSSGDFTIHSDAPIVHCTLYNAHGQVVKTMALSEPSQSLYVELPAVQAGLYFVQTTDATQRTSTLKLVVKP